MKAVRHFLEEPYTTAGVNVPTADAFTARWSAATLSGVASGSLVANTGVGGRYFFSFLSSAIKSAHSWDRVGSATNVDISTAIIGQAITSGSRKLLIARGSGAAGSEQCYAAALDTVANTISIIKIVAGVITSLSSTSYTFPTSDVFTAAYFSVSGSTLRLTVWPQLSSRPTTPQLTVTGETSIPGAGWAGMGIAGNADGSQRLALDWMAMGTSGDAAPVAPIFQDAYKAWLADDSKARAVLLEVDCLGQLPNGTANSSTICVSNVPFVTKPEDQPANQCYEEILIQAPTFTRRMDEILKGRSTPSYGDALIKNELDSQLQGRLDEWLTWNWDGREVRMWLLDPNWRKVDARKVLRGVVQDVYCPSANRVGFKLRDKSALLTVPMTKATIGGTGPNAGQLKPILLGYGFNITPVLSNPSTLEYQLHDQAMYYVDDVRDAGVSLKKTGVISSVNAGTDTLSVASPHNLVAGYWGYFTGTPPAGLTAGTPNAGPFYCVIAAGLTATDFRVSLSAGGAAVDITGTTAGATFVFMGWQPDYANGKFKLVASPAGQITCDAYGHTTGGVYQADSFALLQHLLVNRAGLPAGDCQNTVLIPVTAAPLNIYLTEQANVDDVIDLFMKTLGAWWTIKRDGTFGCGFFALPAATASNTLLADDIATDSFVISNRILPQDPEFLTYAKNWTPQDSGLAGAVTAANRALYAAQSSVATFNAPPVIGLDVPANHMLRGQPPQRETLFTTQADAVAEGQRQYAIFSKASAVLELETLAMGTQYELGDTLGISHPRYGFGNGMNVFIVGLAETYVPKVRVTCEVFSQLPGQFPVTTATNRYVDETNFQ